MFIQHTHTHTHHAHKTDQLLSVSFLSTLSWQQLRPRAPPSPWAWHQWQSTLECCLRQWRMIKHDEQEHNNKWEWEEMRTGVGNGDFGALFGVGRRGASTAHKHRHNGARRDKANLLSHVSTVQTAGRTVAMATHSLALSTPHLVFHAHFSLDGNAKRHVCQHCFHIFDLLFCQTFFLKHTHKKKQWFW